MKKEITIRIASVLIGPKHRVYVSAGEQGLFHFVHAATKNSPKLKKDLALIRKSYEALGFPVLVGQGEMHRSDRILMERAVYAKAEGTISVEQYNSIVTRVTQVACHACDFT